MVHLDIQREDKMFMLLYSSRRGMLYSFARRTFGWKVEGWVVRGLVGHYFTPHCLSPPWCIHGYRRHTAWGNLVMDLHPIQGGVKLFLRVAPKLWSRGPLPEDLSMTFTLLFFDNEKSFQLTSTSLYLISRELKLSREELNAAREKVSKNYFLSLMCMI